MAAEIIRPYVPSVEELARGMSTAIVCISALIASLKGHLPVTASTNQKRQSYSMDLSFPKRISTILLTPYIVKS
jgi:hypothetical protein